MTETVDEFLARGGAIKGLPAYASVAQKYTEKQKRSLIARKKKNKRVLREILIEHHKKKKAKKNKPTVKKPT